nr:peptidoglycan DD-metalloendopeptidase family protein [uncultured Psychroserpens sp.]
MSKVIQNTFSHFLYCISPQPLHILDSSIVKSDYIGIDLSTTNEELKHVDVSSSKKLESYIDHHIKLNKAKVAFGGYLETRAIYQRSDYFNDNKSNLARNIHLGIDLWIAAETPIFAPLDAIVHSFNNNKNFGDYGPTIILEHKIKNITFYTLYGHLSLSSIKTISIGQVFKKGELLATLGSTSVNGDYPPHLHFQIIKDIEHYVGDYPGVSTKRDLEFYNYNCPDPNMLLKLK